jgi:hypothetical protein
MLLGHSCRCGNVLNLIALVLLRVRIQMLYFSLSFTVSVGTITLFSGILREMNQGVLQMEVTVLAVVNGLVVVP